MSDQKLLTDGTLIIPTDVDVEDVGRVILDQKGTKFCSIFYRDAGEIVSGSISRQSAIDAVEFGITYAKAIDVNTGESKELFKEENDALKKAVERLKELPSAERTGILQRCQPVGIGIMRWKCSECGEVYEKPVNYCNHCGFKLIRQR